MFAQTKYEAASPAQIRDYAVSFLQLDMKGTESDAEVLAKVKDAQPGQDFIFVKHEESAALQEVGSGVGAESIPDVTVDVGDRGKGTLGRQDPRCRIMIPATDTPDGATDVAVGVNGVVWQLKRGVDLDIPLRVYLALMGCQQDIVRHDSDGEVTISTGQRFAIQATSIPSPEAITAWQKQTEGRFCP